MRSVLIVCKNNSKNKSMAECMHVYKKFNKNSMPIIEQNKFMVSHKDEDGELRHRGECRIWYYCKECLSLRQKTKICLKCEQKFYPGCRIAFLCSNCYQLNSHAKEY